MKKTIIIGAIITVNLLIAICIFISTCCFFPAMKSEGQTFWLLTKEGVVIGCPKDCLYMFERSNNAFQINNPTPYEKLWGRDLPMTITQNTKNMTQLNYYRPPVGSNDSYDGLESVDLMSLEPSDYAMDDTELNDLTDEDFSRTEDKPNSYYCLESLDPVTKEVLSRINLESEYDFQGETILRICIPPHLLMFTNEEPGDVSSRRGTHFYQPAKGDYKKTWTNVVFLENDSHDPLTWKKRTFDDYPPGDAHLLCWEYSPDYQGCFLLFEVYPEECNELIYFNMAKHEVMAKVKIQGYREEFQVFSILSDQKHIMVYNEKMIEFYSLPDLNLVKTVSHPELELSASRAIAATTDLRYIAFGEWKINILDTTSQDFFVLDARHYDRINMSRFYRETGFMSIYWANVMYEMQQLCFFKDEHILTGLTYNGQYFQWNVDTRKQIFHNDLSVKPK